MEQRTEFFLFVGSGCRGEFFGSSVRFWTEKIKWALFLFFFFLHCLVKVLYRWSRPWGWKEIIGCFRSIVYSWGLKGVCNKREEKVGEIRRKKKGQISILVFKIFLKIFKNFL